jgi:predicted enzyme related to lactoylglutathione lyase
MARPPIDQLITFLYTRDLATTAHFYENLLGLPLAVDQGDCRIYQVSAGGLLGFCQRAQAPEEPAGIIVTIVTPDVDAWHDALVEQGVAFATPPAHNPRYGIYHCFLRDPNGYLVEIQSFL